MFFQELLGETSIRLVLWGVGLIALLILVSKLDRERHENVKILLFWSMTSIIVFVTIFIVGSTIRENLTSSSGGPVHWHADFKILNCGEELDIINPVGLVNRVGTSVLHEHGDNRIHVEGVIQQPLDASLEHFFEVIGGEMRTDSLSVPTDSGLVIMNDKGSCNGRKGFVQMFRYYVDGEDVIQEKVLNFPDYVPAPYSLIPPGECIIIEFDQLKEKTDIICTFYDIAIQEGDLNYTP